MFGRSKKEPEKKRKHDLSQVKHGILIGILL